MSEDLRPGFTPEALENIRQRYVETDETQVSIGKDYGVTHTTIRNLAKTYGWPMRHYRAPRILPNDLKVKLDAEKALLETAKQREEPPDLSVAERLERAVENELSGLERLRLTFTPESSWPADAERVARMLERLTETLFKVRRLRVPDRAAHGGLPASDYPADADAFRRQLAQRINALFQNRSRGETSSPSDAGGTNSV